MVLLLVDTSVTSESENCALLDCYTACSGYSFCVCHHGMVRPQVVDGGMASNMEGSCEYIE